MSNVLRFFFFSSHSQIRMTVQPRDSNLEVTKAARETQAEAIGAFMFEVQELDTLTDFDEKLWLTIIDTVTVHADGQMTFKFQGGKTLTSY